MEMTINYVKGRKQSGILVGSFHIIQHHCANMLTDTNTPGSSPTRRHGKQERDFTLPKRLPRLKPGSVMPINASPNWATSASVA